MIKLYHKSRKKSTLYAFFMHCVDFFSALVITRLFGTFSFARKKYFYQKGVQIAKPI